MLTSLGSALSHLGSTESVPGAIVLTLVTLGIAFVSWTLTTLGKQIASVYTWKRAKKASYLQFYTSVKIRKENTSAIYGTANKIAYLKSVSQGGPGFRAYVATSDDDNAIDLIRPFLPSMPSRLMYLIKSYEGYDSLLDHQYIKIGTEEFRELSKARKLAVIEALYEAAADVVSISESVMEGSSGSLPTSTRSLKRSSRIWNGGSLQQGWARTSHSSSPSRHKIGQEGQFFNEKCAPLSQR